MRYKGFVFTECGHLIYGRREHPERGRRNVVYGKDEAAVRDWIDRLEKTGGILEEFTTAEYVDEMETQARLAHGL